MDCLNCGAALRSAFCAECGQRAVPAHPTMSELAGDAFAELSGWDGKFISTFRTLLTKPGELTRQFVEGKRVRFIAPVSGDRDGAKTPPADSTGSGRPP